MKKIILFLTIMIFWLTACSPAAGQETETPAAAGTSEPAVLRVMTHDSFAATEELIRGFEQENNVEVQILPSGDTGTALNKAILAKDNPIADVFYGVDNTFLSRALAEGIFEPYESPVLQEIPDKFELDSEHRVLPVDYGDVCLNYDRAYFEDNSLQPPQNLEDLLDPAYEGLLVVENPATSSPGLAFLLATIGHFGQDGYLDYWQGLVDQQVLVVNDWENAYYSEFSVHGGTRPLVVSYASSPPAEVIFAEEPIDQAPTGVVTGDGSCFRQIEFIGILAGTENRALAEAWIDFMLSKPMQEVYPLQMFVFPVNENAALPEPFTQNAVIPENPAEVSPDLIAENRETWIQNWTETVIR